MFPTSRGDIKIIASFGEGWEHVSASLFYRCPTWDEMCMVKDFFWGEEDTVIQYHPAKSEYINYHPHCLHLWRPINKEILCPPKNSSRGRYGESDMTRIAKTIRLVRATDVISQRDLAEQIGIQRSAIRKVETGKSVDAETALKIMIWLFQADETITPGSKDGT